jgi:hypothetical protein
MSRRNPHKCPTPRPARRNSGTFSQSSIPGSYCSPQVTLYRLGDDSCILHTLRQQVSYRTILAVQFLTMSPGNHNSSFFPASLKHTSVHDTGQIVFANSVNVHNLLFLLSSLIVNVNLARRNKGRTSHPHRGLLAGSRSGRFRVLAFFYIVVYDFAYSVDIVRQRSPSDDRHGLQANSRRNE